MVNTAEVSSFTPNLPHKKLRAQRKSKRHMLLPQKKIKKLRHLRALAYNARPLDLILSIFLKTERGTPKRTMEMTVVPSTYDK